MDKDVKVQSELERDDANRVSRNRSNEDVDVDIDDEEEDDDELLEARKRVKKFLNIRPGECEEDLVDVEITDNKDDEEKDNEEKLTINKVRSGDKDHSTSRGEGGR